jgi:CBS domain-containing protein
MSAHKLRRLPVVEGEKLVGLVSLRDIIELYRVLK